jgi:hypothetical protein
MYVPAEKMGSILTQMGQSFDENELQKEVGRAARKSQYEFH